MKGLIYISAIWIFASLLSACTEEDDNIDLLDSRDQFLGTWSVTDSQTKDSYDVQIIKDPSNSAQVLIQRFYNLNNCTNPPYAIVASSSIYIPTQLICDDSFEVNGDGEIDKNKIEWTYTVNDGSSEYSYVATYTRK